MKALKFEFAVFSVFTFVAVFTSINAVLRYLSIFKTTSFLLNLKFYGPIFSFGSISVDSLKKHAFKTDFVCFLSSYKVLQKFVHKVKRTIESL